MPWKTENYYYNIVCTKIIDIGSIDVAIRKIIFYLYEGIACALQIPQESD